MDNFTWTDRNLEPDWRINIDYLKNEIAAANGGPVGLPPQIVRKIIIELRAAREVVKSIVLLSAQIEREDDLATKLPADES